MNLSEIKSNQKLGTKRPSVNLNLSKISSGSKGDIKSARFPMKNHQSPQSNQLLNQKSFKIL
jgi:hypothetical protein